MFVFATFTTFVISAALVVEAKVRSGRLVSSQSVSQGKRSPFPADMPRTSMSPVFPRKLLRRGKKPFELKMLVLTTLRTLALAYAFPLSIEALPLLSLALFSPVLAFVRDSFVVVALFSVSLEMVIGAVVALFSVSAVMVIGVVVAASLVKVTGVVVASSFVSAIGVVVASACGELAESPCGELVESVVEACGDVSIMFLFTAFSMIVSASASPVVITACGRISEFARGASSGTFETAGSGAADSGAPAVSEDCGEVSAGGVSGVVAVSLVSAAGSGASSARTKSVVTATNSKEGMSNMASFSLNSLMRSRSMPCRFGK